MLATLRNFSKSWGAYIFLGILALSFGLFWNISDLFQDRGSANVLATVGTQKIDMQMFQKEWNAHLEEQGRIIAQQTQKPVHALDLKKMAIQSGHLQQVLQFLIQKQLVLQEAKHLGISIHDDHLRETITKLNAFQESDGSFNKERFQQFLVQSNITEARFVETLRDDITLSTLMGSLTGAVVSPDVINEKFFAFDLEQRRVQWLFLTEDLLEEHEYPKPTQQELEIFYQSHQDMFKAPEYRKFSMILIPLESWRKKHTVKPEEIKAEYAQRKKDFQTPEQRKLFQILFRDKTAADKALALLRNKGKFQDIPKLLGGNVASGQTVGWVERNNLPQQVADQIFSLPKGRHTQVFEVGEVVTIFVVEDIKPSALIPLEQVSAALEKDIQTQKAHEVLFPLTKQIEDDVAGGMTFAEIAKKNKDMELLTCDFIDAHGITEAQEKAPSHNNLPEILKIAFETEEGTESHISELPNGDFVMVKVESVKSAKFLTLEEAKHSVYRACAAAQRDSFLQKRTESLAKNTAAASRADAKLIAKATLPGSFLLKRNGSIETQQKSYQDPHSKRFTKIFGEKNAFSQDNTDKIFQAPKNHAVALTQTYRDAETQEEKKVYLVAKVLDKIPVTEKDLAKHRPHFTKLMTQALAADIVEFYFQYLQSQHPVKINQGLLSRLANTD